LLSESQKNCSYQTNRITVKHQSSRLMSEIRLKLNAVARQQSSTGEFDPGSE
jgi:hypothetical protein